MGKPVIHKKGADKRLFSCLPGAPGEGGGDNIYRKTSDMKGGGERLFSLAWSSLAHRSQRQPASLLGSASYRSRRPRMRNA